MKSLAIAMTLLGFGASLTLTQAAELTPQTLVDRAKIEDLISRHYDDASTRARPGAEAPRRKPPTLASLKPQVYVNSAARRAAAAEARNADAHAFVVTIGNPVIVVRGDTATAQVLFTEFVTEREGDAPKVLRHGKEFGRFEKVQGEWRYSQRHVDVADASPPEGWSG